MKIVGYCAAHCIDEGEPTQLAGCGILLTYIDFADRQVSRKYAFALGYSDSELAIIQAVKLTLASIKPVHRKYNSILSVSDDRVVDILNGGDSKHKEAAKSLLQWFNFYSDLKILYSDINETALELAKNAALTQMHYDSGTIYD